MNVKRDTGESRTSREATLKAMKDRLTQKRNQGAVHNNLETLNVETIWINLRRNRLGDVQESGIQACLHKVTPCLFPDTRLEQIQNVGALLELARYVKERPKFELKSRRRLGWWKSTDYTG